MLTKKEKELLKKQKREMLAFISIKSSVIFPIKSAIISFFFSLFMAYIEVDTSPPMVTMCAIGSALVYLMLAKYEFGSWYLCFKLTVIYFRIILKKLNFSISKK